MDLAKGKSVGGLTNPGVGLDRMKALEAGYEKGKRSRARSGMGDDLGKPNAVTSLKAAEKRQNGVGKMLTADQMYEQTLQKQQYASLITDRPSWSWFDDPIPALQRSFVKDVRDMKAALENDNRRGKQAGADKDYNHNVKLGGVDSEDRAALTKPTQAPPEILGTNKYYEWRDKEFKLRNPNLESPGYYMDYGDKYANVFCRGSL